MTSPQRVGFYETAYVSEAAFLQMQGHDVAFIEWRDNRCYFLFDPSRALMQDVNLYNHDDARVEPKVFGRTYGDLKRRMNEERPKQGDVASGFVGLIPSALSS